MRFAQPWWLLALPVAWGAVLLIVRYGRRTVPARQHRWAVWLRLVVVSLLVASLAQPPLNLRFVDRILAAARYRLGGWKLGRDE